jgi:hypothetical protein
MYIGQISHFTAVDISQTVKAYHRLIEHVDLRRQMGESARRRAREIFGWRVIIRRYQELWTELAQRRSAAASQSHTFHSSAHPLRLDPFTLFANYATAQLSPATILSVSSDSHEQLLQQYYQTPILFYLNHPGLLGSRDELRQILDAIQAKPQSAGEVVSLFSTTRQEFIQRSLVWLLKVGLLLREYPSF